MTLNINTIKKLLLDKCGVTAIEYACVAGLISIVIVVAVTEVGSSVLVLFDGVVEAFPG